MARFRSESGLPVPDRIAFRRCIRLDPCFTIMVREMILRTWFDEPRRRSSTFSTCSGCLRRILRFVIFA